MRYLSICSGIEAASVAWHGLGWEPVAFSEIEPFPSAVLAHHYPHVPNLGDMTTLPERILSRELEAPDLLVGGPPCQAFSVAGLRRGLDDARGSLTLTYCEIANAIDHLRLADGRDPAIIVYENVPGLLSSKDNAFGCLLAGLAGESEALQAPRGKWRDAGVVVGPQRLAVWRVLDAQFFGVAQRRRRIFLISVALRHPRAWAIAESIFPLSACLSWNSPARGEARKIAASGVGDGPDGGSISGAVTRKWAKGSGGPAGDECYNMVAQPVAHALRGEGFDASEDGTGRGTPIVPVVGSHWDHPSNPHPTLNQSAKGSGGIAASDQELFSQRGSGLVPQAVAFAQNTRDEVRLMNGDGSIVGALAAEPGMKQTCYVAQPVAFHPTQDPISSVDGTTHAMGCGSSQGNATVAVAIRTANTGANGHGIAVDVTHTLDQAQGQAVAQPVAFKVRGGVEVDSAGKAAGKGYLGSEETAFTLAATQDQWIGQPVATFAKTHKPMSATDAEGWSPVDAAPTVTHWPRDRSDAGTDVAVVQPVGTDCYNGAITGDVAATIGTPGSSVNGCGPTVMQPVGSFKPGQSAAARSIGYEAEVAPALEGGGGGNNKPAVHVAMQVRRLTPVECERLQGFPDNWTNIPWRKGMAPDGPRYKALGNSMAVPCMRWIAERIQAATARQESP